MILIQFILIKYSILLVLKNISIFKLNDYKIRAYKKLIFIFELKKLIINEYIEIEISYNKY